MSEGMGEGEREREDTKVRGSGNSNDPVIKFDACERFATHRK